MPVSFAPIAADFHAQHSPFGALASFTLGRHGARGGFSLERGDAGENDVFVGIARGDTVRTLPFYAELQSDWLPYAPAEIRRTMGFASDAWATADGLTLRLLTPAGSVPDPLTISDDELRRFLCPAILAEWTLDNRASDIEAVAFFGIGGAEPLRPLSDAALGLCGVARGTAYGFAAQAGEAVRELLAGDLAPAIRDGNVPLHRLAKRGVVTIHVPPGETRTRTLALGFYRGGIVTSGLRASYLYARLFPDLESVLRYALDHADEWRNRAAERDAELADAPLSETRQFLLSHAAHSYRAATQLLHDENGDLMLSRPDAPHRPLWVVSGGEYRTMNALDNTVDQAFWELRYHPWTLRNTLDLSMARYRYYDETQDVTDPARPRYPGGIALTHDMGVANQFAPHGVSSYERPNETGRFSFMTREQLTNWCLCAALYGITTGDTFWLSLRHDVLIACLHSLLHRDGPDGMRNGITSLDSACCGMGREITTYDTLDAGLRQARASAYLAVKTWAAYLALGRCFDLLRNPSAAALAEEQAALAAQCITARFDADRERFPAVFENGPNDADDASDAAILPIIEGLVFPYLLRDHDSVSVDGPFGEMITHLRTHLLTVLRRGVCVDAASDGIRLSSASANTWMGKLFLAQWVAETVLGVTLAPSVDAAHARWQTEGGCRDFAFTDQVDSVTGNALGSRFFGRGVTAVLWLVSPTTQPPPSSE